MTGLTIKGRIILLGLLGVGGIAFAAGFGVFQLQRFNAHLGEDFADIRRGVATLVNIQSASIDFKTQVQEWKNILIRGNDEAEFAKYHQAFLDQEKATQARLQKARDALKADNDPGMAQAVAEIESVLAHHAELGNAYKSALAGFDRADPEAGKKVDAGLRGKDRATTEGLNALVGKLQAKETEHLSRQVNTAQAAYQRARDLLIALTAAALVVSGVIVWATVRRITRQIAQVCTTTGEIRQALDLTQRIPIAGSDEMAQVAASVNALLDEFQNVVRRMKDAGQHVAHASDALADSVAKLSAAVDRQNESTAAMAASMQQMAVSVAHVSDSSSTAQSVAQSSLVTAQTGGEVIESATRGMLAIADAVRGTSQTLEELSRHTTEIGSIVGVIKEVADQTNLLALNAAIEAARAGEQGRGFAVVADEVRKLAERTTASTREIGQLIASIQGETLRVVDEMHTTVNHVGANVNSAKGAGQSIVEIREGSQRVCNVSAEIDVALKEQRAAGDLIARQVEVISSMSEENTAAMNDAKAASVEMKQLSEEMHGIVSRFAV